MSSLRLRLRPAQRQARTSGAVAGEVGGPPALEEPAVLDLEPALLEQCARSAR